MLRAMVQESPAAVEPVQDSARPLAAAGDEE
jgi:hypothetical protein